MIALIALLIGIVFGAGLTLADMVNPQRVTDFFDVLGTWDPTLAFVMGGALIIAVPGFKLVLRRSAPIFAAAFHLPVLDQIDRRLMLGSLIFGLGWGIGGFCPGPAIAALVSGMIEPLAFTLSMMVGLYLARRLVLGSA
jgi:uncharacterized membrane protein YedE/YeeE